MRANSTENKPTVFENFMDFISEQAKSTPLVMSKHPSERELQTVGTILLAKQWNTSPQQSGKTRLFNNVILEDTKGLRNSNTNGNIKGNTSGTNKWAVKMALKGNNHKLGD